MLFYYVSCHHAEKMTLNTVCFSAGIILLIFITKCCGEDFNLFGQAGQAYSIEVNVGHPHQKLSILVDTGSTTLAIASYPHQDNDRYFNSKNTTSIYDSGKQVQAKYSQGMWIGRLVSDFIQFPSIPTVPEVRSDIALITKSHKFFMNGSGWQGLLGLAYLPVGAWGENVIVESWLDSLERSMNKPMSFELKLCGPQGFYNATHAGYFKMLLDQLQSQTDQTFRTPILRKRWYEVGVISIRVLPYNMTNNISNYKDNRVTSDKTDEDRINQETCKKLNEEKSIVDSGTTNIRIPDVLFREVVDELRNAAQASNIILDEFWYHGEAACWPEPQEWSLPWLAVDLLSDHDDRQYFTLELPPKNYMRVVTARNSSGTVSEFCYKLGLEAGGKETVLGYTAMEGFEVLFNRSAGWISWKTSNCGPDAKISGPYNFSRSLTKYCELTRPVIDVAISIKAAQWALCVVSIVAAAVLIYLLAPCVKMMLMRRLPSSQQISLSQAALVGTSESG